MSRDPYHMVELQGMGPPYVRETSTQRCATLVWKTAIFSLFTTSYAMVYTLGYLMGGYEYKRFIDHECSHNTTIL